jgi:hypothetical protein
VLDLDAVLAEDFVERLAGRDVGLEADDLLVGERLELDGFLLRERMLRMADEDERLLAQRDDFQLGILDRIGGKSCRPME